MGMPDNATRIVEWLKQRRGRSFCHTCVSSGADVSPRQQVNQIIRPLGQTKEYRYTKSTCSGCGANLKCIGYFG